MDAQMQIVLVNRATENWDQLTLDNFFNKPDEWRYEGPEQRSHLINNISKWENYSVNFFQYRHRLKEIAQKYWPLPAITMDEALEIKDPNIVLVPIDDDDIVHPNIVSTLSRFYTSDIDSVSWTAWEYSVLKNPPHLIKQHEHNFETVFFSMLIPSNCYSMRSTVATRGLLKHHDQFSAIRSISRLHMPIELGLRFLHPGGTFLMQHMETFGEDLICLDKPRIPADLYWGVDFINEVRDLTKSIFE